MLTVRPVSRRRGRLSDERGSLILGMGVMMIVGFLSIALLGRSIGTLHSVRHTQDFSAGLAVADGGLADAMFVIDGGAETAFTGSGSLGEGTFAYEASKVSTNEWLVRSEGTVNGVEHAIEARIWRDVLYPYALFTNQDLTLNGNGGLDIYSYNSTTGQTDTGNAVIGSNHAITVNGGGGGDAQHYYTPQGSCSGCTNGQQETGPRTSEDPPEPTSYQPCPTTDSDGDGKVEFGSTINGQNGLTFRCTANIEFYSGGPTTLVSPPVIIWVAPNYSVDLSGADINVGGKGRDFRILKAGTGALTVGLGSAAAKINGVIYAPSSDVTVDGGQMHLDGSLTFNSFTVNGNPNFSLAYDDTISTISSQDWEVLDWREIPSSSFTPSP